MVSPPYFVPDDELPGVLVALRDTAVITPTQAQTIHDRWQDSVGDLWSDPRVRGVRSHTRVVVDRLRGQLCTPQSPEGEAHA